MSKVQAKIEEGGGIVWIEPDEELLRQLKEEGMEPPVPGALPVEVLGWRRKIQQNSEHAKIVGVDVKD